MQFSDQDDYDQPVKEQHDQDLLICLICIVLNILFGSSRASWRKVTLVSSCKKVRAHRGNQGQRNDPRTTRSKTETAFPMSLQLIEEMMMMVLGTAGERDRQQYFGWN